MKFTLFEQEEILRLERLLNCDNCKVEKVEVFKDIVLINAIYWEQTCDKYGLPFVERVTKEQWKQIYKLLNEKNIEIIKYNF